ncbi:MAG: Synerg-CTERM sorting domain-containing protein [Synergistes sp.]|nr:Synerg-CTERM sorting domain-containing protein [Synergistes sp.]
MAIFKKSLRLFAAVLACAVFAGTASADVLYLGIGGSDYAPDRFGLIRGKEAPTKNVVTGLGGSAGAKAFPFRNANGSSRVAVAQCSSYSSEPTDTIDIYDPSKTDWSTPLKEIGGSSNPVTNVRGLAYSGKYIYICGYNTPSTIARFDTTDEKYANDKNVQVQCASASYDAHCEGIVAYGGYLYVIVTYSDSMYNYLNSKLLKYDTDLTLKSEITLNSRNTDGGTTGAYMLNGHSLYITSIGGSQGAVCNSNSMIEKVDLSTATPSSKTIISNDALLTQQQGDVLGICASADWSYNFASLYVDASDNLYIGMNGYDSSWNNSRIVISASETALGDPATLTAANVVKKFAPFSAYVPPHMSFDTNNARLYFGAGEGTETKLFFYDGLTWDSYSETELGAKLSDFCVLLDSTSPAPSGSGGSGGCNAGFGALVLVVIALGAAKRRK